jgi:hypothetical protein
MNLRDVKPLNERGQKHGLWESYYPNSALWYRGNFY